MPSRLPKTTSDIKVWGPVLNDAMRPLLATDQLLIVPDSNNPPKVLSGTKFYVWNTDTYLTPLSPATGNVAYPVNTNVTYPIPYVVFEQADVTFSWNTAAGATSAGIPVKSNSTLYYLFCSATQDVDSTSIGKGKYGVSTNAPTYDYTKNGWYSSDGKVLARFYVDGSGNVISGSLCQYTSDLAGELYTTTTSAPSITGLNMLRDGGCYIVRAFLYHNIGTGGTNMFFRCNGDGATDANWYSMFIYQGGATGAGQNSALIYYQPTAVAASMHQVEMTIKQVSDKIYYHSIYGINQNTSYLWAESYGNIRDSKSVTNLTQIDFVISGGSSPAFTAGSDIRVYRSR